MLRSWCNLSIKLVAIFISIISLTSCSGGGSCQGCSAKSGGTFSFTLTAPVEYPAGVAETVYLTITNTSSLAVTDLIYFVPGPGESGNSIGESVIVEPYASESCPTLAVGASCVFPAILESGSVPGSFTVFVTGKTDSSFAEKSINQITNKLDIKTSFSQKVTANIGLADCNKQNGSPLCILPGNQTVVPNINGNTPVAISVLVESTSNVNNITILSNGQPVTATAYPSASSYAPNSVITYYLNLPKNTFYSANIQATCNGGGVCSNTVQVESTVAGAGILTVTPSYTVMSQSLESVTYTLTNTGKSTISNIIFPVSTSDLTFTNINCNGSLPAATANVVNYCSYSVSLAQNYESTGLQPPFVVNYNNGLGTQESTLFSINLLAYGVTFAYLTNSTGGVDTNGSISACSVNNINGSLSNCITFTDADAFSGANLSAPAGIAISGNFLFIANSTYNESSSGGPITSCLISESGSLSGCTNLTTTYLGLNSTDIQYPVGVTISGATMYINAFDGSGNGIYICSIVSGGLAGCSENNTIAPYQVNSSFIGVNTSNLFFLQESAESGVGLCDNYGNNCSNPLVTGLSNTTGTLTELQGITAYSNTVLLTGDNLGISGTANVFVCNQSLTSCSLTGQNFTSKLIQPSINNGYIYIPGNAPDNVNICAIDVNGNLSSSCTSQGNSIIPGISLPKQVAFTGSTAMTSNPNPLSINYECLISTLSATFTFNQIPAFPAGTVVNLTIYDPSSLGNASFESGQIITSTTCVLDNSSSCTQNISSGFDNSGLQNGNEYIQGTINNESAGVVPLIITGQC